MSDRPNILLLFTDMQRADTIAALGNPVIRTPALDRLAGMGTAFTRAYSPSPVCVPARHAMHYGRWTSCTGCTDNQPMPPDDGRSYAQCLTAAGYRTHAIGKLHFTPDHHGLRGFQTREIQEEIYDEPERDDYQVYLNRQGLGHITDPHGVRGEMYYQPQPAQMSAAHHPTQWIGDRTLAFLDEAKAGCQPWYLTASFIHPHPPFCPPAPWHKLYRGPDMPLPLFPADHEAHWTAMNRVQNRYKYRDQGYDLNLLRQIKAYYYACISFVDFQVGRILDALERNGQLDNTIIAFSSDHGEYLGDYGCFGKRSMHDASARVPLLLRVPGQRGGQVCARPASLIDLAPTFCGLAGAAGADWQGVRLDRLADGAETRDAVFAHRNVKAQAEYAIFTGDWTFWYSAADDREFCYHNRTDPQQQRLVAERPFHPEIATLRQRLREHLTRCGVAGDALDGAGWKRYPTRPPVGRNPDEGLIIQDHPWADLRIPGYST